MGRIRWEFASLGLARRRGHSYQVRALSAKAESTSFEHEADALTAKAQEFMARHAIDEAVAQTGGAKTGRHHQPDG
jgi:hypothetical protein